MSSNSNFPSCSEVWHMVLLCLRREYLYLCHRPTYQTRMVQPTRFPFALPWHPSNQLPRTRNALTSNKGHSIAVYCSLSEAHPLYHLFVGCRGCVCFLIPLHDLAGPDCVRLLALVMKPRFVRHQFYEDVIYLIWVLEMRISHRAQQ